MGHILCRGLEHLESLIFSEDLETNLQEMLGHFSISDSSRRVSISMIEEFSLRGEVEKCSLWCQGETYIRMSLSFTPHP